ncbi:MAG: Tim44 domain-containing protein [Alphaproteobacteria bacterium]|nr:Tim44 domain-containing protein [Alphaproteobacteria bacterium]
MGEGFQFLDIIFFALVAGFILLRLRNTLGKRTGNERPPPPFGGGESPEGGRDNVVRLPGRAPEDAAGSPPEDAALEPKVRAGVEAIRATDPAFSVNDFLGGARSAYEMIVHSFAVGDTDTLRPLLSNEVFGRFAAEIERREKAGETQETTLVGIEEAELAEASVDGRTAEVTVRFKSEMVGATRDAKGEVIDGDPRAPRKVIDIWTFARNLKSSDPNWSLIRTRSGDA